MAGILIYPKKEIKRNQFSINKFQELLNVELVCEDYNGAADFVINRTNNYKIGEKFEKKGIRVFNSSSLSKIANNKQLCYELMKKNNIDIMPINYTGTPVVRKKIDGHGGTEVEMLFEKEKFKEGYVYQMPCNNLGRDVRVWLIGGELICSILRESKTDFRSNYCLGASASIYNLNNDEKSLINKIYSICGGDYIGIDFIFNNDKIVFNEIEDTVGARMVYDKTSIDIIQLYCEYIKKELKC